MEKINLCETRMEEIEVCGIPALFTPHRADRTTLYPGLHLYEVQTQSGGRPFSLMKQVSDSFYGTVLTPIPIPLPPNGRRPLWTGDFITGLGEGSYTPAEFERKYLSPDHEG